MNILLTGEKQIGKTTICKKLIRLMKSRKLNPTGLLTPAIYNTAGKKVGFKALDVGTGSDWPLASTEEAYNGPRVGMYEFNQHGLNQAIEIIKSACLNPKDLLFLDEIGPFELKQQSGFTPALDLLPLHGSGHLLLVVRLSSLVELQQKFSEATFQIIEVTLENRNSIPQAIEAKLWSL